jgi:hypothetical protein
MLTPDELARDLAVIEAATEGPWEVNSNYKHMDDYAGSIDTYGNMVRSNSRYVEGPTKCVCSTNAKTRDVEFISAARNRWPLYVAEVQRQAARIKELEAEKTKLLKGPNYNQGWELDAEVERLTARVAELEARLRSLVGKLVEAGELLIEKANFPRSGWPSLALTAWDAAVKEATDAK